jgi:integrase
MAGEQKKGSIWYPKTKTGAPRRWPSGRVRYRGKVAWPDGTRQDFAVEEINCASEEIAAERVAEIQAEIDRSGAAVLGAALAPKPAATVDTNEMTTWFDAWIASKVARGQTSTADPKAHYERHIRAAIGSKHVRDWTADDMRTLVTALDGKVSAGEISAKTASNIYGTATKMVADAVRSKVAALRVRVDNPTKDVEGPDRGDDKAKQFLYPSEFLRLISCADIGLRWRRAIALAIYLFPRAGELSALRWDAIDLEHGTIHIHEALDRRSHKVSSTKSGRSRRFAIEPSIMPLLRVMHEERTGELVCWLPRRMADRLRGWLERAGVTRRELRDETSATTKALGWHDLRATGLTWMAVRGDEPLKIMQRAGHADLQTTQIYVRTAEAIEDGFGAVFPPLPAALLEADSDARVSTLPRLRDQKRNDVGAGHGVRTRDIQLGKRR